MLRSAGIWHRAAQSGAWLRAGAPRSAGFEALEDGVEIGGEVVDENVRFTIELERHLREVQKRAIEPVDVLEVRVRRAIAVALVAEHGVTDAGEVAPHLVGASLLGMHGEQRMAADDLLSRVASPGSAGRSRFFQRPRDSPAVSRDTAHEREVLLLAGT